MKTKRSGRLKQSKSTIEAKKELVSLSKKAKEHADFILRKTGEVLTINQVLILMYRQKSGCKDFKTFNEWSSKGFKILPGSKSFRVWARPRNAPRHSDDSPSMKSSAETEDTYKFWPTCCLYNESQVEPREGTEPHLVNVPDDPNLEVLQYSVDSADPNLKKKFH